MTETVSRAIWNAMPLLLLCVLGCSPSPDSGTATKETVTVEQGSAWREWGGPNRDFKLEATGLSESWPIEGPPLLWSRTLGEGHSAIVADRGVIYTMYRHGKAEVVIALRSDIGETLWEHRYDAPAREGHVIQFGTGPNATPLLTDDHIITLGYAGALNCLDRRTGEVVWSHSLLDDFGGEVLEFGYSASPISHDGTVVVLVGGERYGALALDPSDGSVAWSTPPSSVSYATPIIIDLEGQEQLVYFTADEIVGAEAGVGGKLWSYPVLNQYRNNATGPLWGEDRRLWVATQLDGGTRVLRLTRGDGGTSVEDTWTSDQLSIHFWNTLRIDDTVYASVGGNGSVMAAVDVTSGEILWRERGFEKVNFLHIGDRTILLDANGHLALATLSPAGIEVHAQARILEGPTWTAPTQFGTTLFVRDKQSIRAFDLGATPVSGSISR